MKKVILLGMIATAALALPANASLAQFGTITAVYGMRNGAILFNTSGARSGTVPACQGPGLTQRYALDASTISGQSYASVLMTAYALKKRVYVQGTGTCDIWTDTETVSYIMVEDVP
jgi:hypothetical protein